MSVLCISRGPETEKEKEQVEKECDQTVNLEDNRLIFI